MPSTRRKALDDIRPGPAELISNEGVRVLVAHAVVAMERAAELVLGNQGVLASAEKTGTPDSKQHRANDGLSTTRPAPRSIPPAHRTVYRTPEACGTPEEEREMRVDPARPGRSPGLAFPTGAVHIELYAKRG